MQVNEEWVTMREAATRLKVTPSKLSRLAKSGKIRTKDDPVDERVTLVEFNEVRALLESSIRYKR
jgi:DNA-binding MarR family transcriptional regulator